MSKFLYNLTRSSNNNFLKQVIISISLTLLYTLFNNQGSIKMNIRDGASIVGLIFLVVAVFRLINKMHFFDSTIYGFKKLISIIKNEKDPEVTTYIKFLEDYNYDKPIGGVFLIAVVYISFSFIML